MTYEKTTLSTGTRPECFRTSRDREEAIHAARAVIFGLMFSPLVWVLVVVAVQRIAAFISG